MAIPALGQNPSKLLFALHILANVHRSLGDLDHALVCLHRCDEIALANLLPIPQSFHLTSIAHIYLQQGRIDDALRTYRRAVELSQRARHADGHAQSLRALGDVLFGLGRDTEALPCVRQAALLFAQLEDREAEAEMVSRAAAILERMRVPGRGGRRLEDGGGSSPRVGRRQGRARCARGNGADGAPARGLAGRRDSRFSSRAGARDDARRQSPRGRASQHARDSRMAKREVSRGAPALRGRARAGPRPGRPRARRPDAQQPRRDAEPAPPARRSSYRSRGERRPQPGARRTTARGARARRARGRVACPGPGRDRRHLLRAVALAPAHARRSHGRGMDVASYRGDARGERRRVKGKRDGG